MTVRGDAVLRGGPFDGMEQTVRVGLDGEPIQAARCLRVIGSEVSASYRYVGSRGSIATYIVVNDGDDGPCYPGSCGCYDPEHIQ